MTTRRLVRALVTLSRQQWLTERTAAARTSAERAFELARPLGDSYQNALATLNLGGLLVVIDREEDGLPYLDEALGIAERCGAASVAALCRNYRGSALLQLGDLRGCEDLLAAWRRRPSWTTTSTSCGPTTTSSRACGGSASTARRSATSSRRRASAATGTSASTATCSPPAGPGWR